MTNEELDHFEAYLDSTPFYGDRTGYIARELLEEVRELRAMLAHVHEDDLAALRAMARGVPVVVAPGEYAQVSGKVKT